MALSMISHALCTSLHLKAKKRAYFIDSRVTALASYLLRDLSKAL